MTGASRWPALGRALHAIAALGALQLAGGCDLFAMAPDGEPDPFQTGAFKDDWTGADKSCAAAACVELPMMTMATALPIRPANLPASLAVPASVTANLIIRASSRCQFIDTALGKIVDNNGNACLTAEDQVVAFQRVRQGDGSELGVFFAKNVALQRELRVRGEIPLVIVAQGQLRIEAELFAGAYSGESGVGAPSYPSQGDSNDLLYKAGRGPGGGGAPQIMVGNAGGGGGGFCGRGGAGSGGVTGGATYGTAELSPLLGGSTGGVTEPAKGAGGGGGAVQLVAGGSITIATMGSVAATGHGGGQYGIGGGSGGAILLEAPLVKINGKLSANGGAGASGIQPGADGALIDGPTRGRQEEEIGRRSTTGGDGGGGMSVDGTAGLTSGTADSGPSDSARAGGGGGAGRIRINTRCGALSLGPAAVLSPSLCQSCATQGKVTPQPTSR